MQITMYDTLLQLPLFQGLCQNDFTNIVGKVKLHFSKYKEGERIIKKGTECKELVFLLKGEIMSEATDEEGLFTFCEFYNSPFVIEPYSLFGMHTHYTSSYVAQTNIDVVSIEKTYILSELNKYEIFRLNYLNIISNRAQILYDRLWHIPSQNIEAKITNFILSHAEKPSGRKIIKIKMDDFAQLLDDTRLNVSKALNEMQEKGLLVLHRKEIEIPEIGKLI